MQRKRSASDAFSEPIDLNQTSFANNTSMDNSASENQTLDPVTNHILVSSHEDVCNTNAASDSTESFRGWDRAESSYNATNLQDGFWSSSFNASSGPDARSVDWSFQPSNTNNTSYVGNQFTGMQNYRLNRDSLNVTSNYGNVGTSSGAFLEINDAVDPSSSCKRKALEGTSGQFYPGGSSSSNQPMGKNIVQDPLPNSYVPPGSSCISSVSLNSAPINCSEELNTSSGVCMNRAGPPFYLSSHVPIIAENSARNFTVRSNPMRNFGLCTSQPESRPISNTDFSESRSPLTLPTSPANILSQSHITHVNEDRETHLYPRNGSLVSRRRSSSGSLLVSAERASDVNVQRSQRNNLVYPVTVSAPETRDVLEGQTDWRFSSLRNRFSGSRAGPSSNMRASSAALSPQQNQALQTHQTLLEAASEIRRSHLALFASASPSLDEVTNMSGPQNQSDQRPAAFLIERPGDDVIGRRSVADLESRHRMIRQVLNAMRRGVRLRAEQCLSYGVSLQTPPRGELEPSMHLEPAWVPPHHVFVIGEASFVFQDYALIDPFIDGFAELHDRHRDMRLDVDNMSYEELLALGEQIGEVSTGLSEEKIKSSMKKRKYEAIGGSPNLEPCCICREDYINGDDIGILNCGHEFHTGCIKQWLSVKNLCPICKMTALET